MSDERTCSIFGSGMYENLLLEAEKNVLDILFGGEYQIGKYGGLGTIIINTCEEKVKAKTSLVLIHGFGGGNAYWAQCLEVLSAEYNIYCVELPGFGRSDRFNWTIDEPEVCLEFYCSSIENWRLDIKKQSSSSDFLENFSILGHSLGAHAASAYAIRFPTVVSAFYTLLTF